ncbi:MAG: amino acid ABC transporter permease [candidate division NC10 bacterium]|jgi:polar amino acid transport system permease protein|nr:amino acid ABC transporter permease [candidate division NC10 bacterium]MBI2116281.1 amino acid ABC transporter permease [candidate division NC10 bacterium]MBI2454610.1 amino acid ABC transporter permease [candidate division NC10 bacterium]MBI3084798.1 amino acid ABC transporter permease [candidate division NC10 bacterium]
MPEIFIAFSYKDVLFLLQGALVTVALCAMAFSCGLVVALAIGLMRTARRLRPLQWVAGAYVEVFRGTPLLMQIFIAYFGLSILGLNLPRFVAVSVPLILFTGAFMGEIVRAGIEAIPRGQWEAGWSLGMTYGQLMRYVVAPTAVRIMIPPSVGFLVQLVKGTSLAYVVGYVELTRAGYIISQSTYATMLVFTLVGAIYFGINYPLSLASQRLEVRLKRHA